MVCPCSQCKGDHTEGNEVGVGQMACMRDEKDLILFYEPERKRPALAHP